MASIPKTKLLYQKDGTKHTHTTPLTSISLLSSLPATTQALFKPPENKTAYVVVVPKTVFHVQGGGQPSDTGTISSSAEVENEKEKETTFQVLQVRHTESGVLHMGIFTSPSPSSSSSPSTTPVPSPTLNSTPYTQTIDTPQRLLHSRIHTAGHIIGLAAAQLRAENHIPADALDGKASHYPSAAFVEFTGLIPSTVKPLLQSRVDDLVALNLPVEILFWDEERARRECTGVLESFKSDEDGVRVVRIGDVGSYPCGGTHVRRTGECGRVVVRGVKRQKGVSKVGYEVVDV